ncbi:MAG: ATP-binding cassette domain-containing protein [Actinomycetota bacterium]|nr:ATP-binding cassette domain-containing protein [Actinomycetota bacterium]
MATARGSGVGIRFLFDRQGRPVTPGVARLRRRTSATWGLRGVDFEFEPGETVALVGPNGAGKTTLLRALAGVYEPDEGSLVVEGRVGSLLSVNAGLLDRINGRENAIVLGVLAGLSRPEAKAIVATVEERAGLGPAFGRPAQAYSAGMKARLGMAVIEQVRPEVLLLDEVHEALDAEFRAELERLVERITDAGGIVVAAGHDLGELERICARALLLSEGSVEADGPFGEIAARFPHAHA